MADTENSGSEKAQQKSDNPIEHPDQKTAEREEARARKQETKDLKKDADLNGEAAQESGDVPRDRTEAAEKSGSATNGNPDLFPVVGVGASAGGLEALEAFVSKLPKDSGIAFVLVTHTHPEHKTRLPELLGRKSRARIRTLEDGMTLTPGVVYIPPSDKDPVFKNGTIQLKDRATKREVHMPIDIFLRSLAKELGEKAGCVILSGTGTDGTQGVRAIKEKTGVAVAQSKASARHTGMPESAIGTGLVDYILPPEEVPGQLRDFFRHPVTIHSDKPDTDETQKTAADTGSLQNILAILEQKTRHSFSQYKKSTLIRRIERRMGVTRSRTESEYVKKLQQDDNEINALFQNLLIGVTSFFRDPEVFNHLKKEVLPDLITRSPKEALRVWIPGCSTGEEAYSVAIVLKECMEAHKTYRDMQIFATDIDLKAVKKARSGYYPENIATDVSSDRLGRFFTREKKGYRINKEIREPIVFAVQNILQDPPFLNLDLLVCRNLLIYLESKVQKRLIPLFHYALDSDGVLFLGTSESVGGFTDLFKGVDKKHKIYQKQRTNRGFHPNVHFPKSGKFQPTSQGVDMTQKNGETSKDSLLADITRNMLLKEHAPAAVVTSSKGEILYVQGRTGKYLETAAGNASFQIRDMAREGLRFRLTSAMRQAAEKGGEVKEKGLQVKTNGDYVRLDLIVKPLREDSFKDCLMIVFEEKAFPVQEPEKQKEPGDDSKRVAELERELAKLQQNYQKAVEDLETSNEELRSFNEEMNSSNEELQSTNEELESSREELQSLNEELTTVNTELENKIDEVEDAYNAVNEVLNSTQIALVFLDRELCVERFTKEAGDLVNLIAKDIGRPLDHLSHRLETDHLNEKVNQVLNTLVPVDEEVQTTDGSWYRMRILLRNTATHEIHGVVLTFVNIDTQKKAMTQVEENEKKFRALVEASSEVLYRMNENWSEMRQLHSRGALSNTKAPTDNWLQKYIPSDEQPRVTAAFNKAIENRSIFELEHKVYRKDGSTGRILSRAVPILNKNGEIKEWFGTASDITDRMENGDGQESPTPGSS